VTAADYLDRLQNLLRAGRLDEAVSLSSEALAKFPTDERFMRARAIVLRRASLPAAAEAHLLKVLQWRRVAWAHANLGLLYESRDQRRAIEHHRQAHQLEPADMSYRMALVQALARQGDGELLEEAYQLLVPVLAGSASWPQNDLHIAFHVLAQVCAFDELDALGNPLDLGLKWAEAGNHTALFMLLGRVSGDERERLIELHRIAVRRSEDLARMNPIARPGEDGPTSPEPAIQ
jgi:tetratricopeptide (TPR) repeat protein